MKLGPIIWIEGLIGSGKTTLAQFLAEKLDYRIFLEPVEDNPFLQRFYDDPERWAFPMQMYLLARRFAMQQAATYEALIGNGAILDRGLPGDRVFCKLHEQAGNMHEIEWQTYDYFYNVMAADVRVPSLILFLDVEPETALARIQKRGRTAERGIDLDYLRQLRSGYMDLLVEIDSGRHVWAQGMKVVRWPWNVDDQSFQPVLDEVNRQLS